MVQKGIGRKIGEIRRQSRLTQSQFAAHIDVHPSYVGPMEKGLKCPSFETLMRIAEKFDIPFYEFFLDRPPGVVDPLLEMNLLLSPRPEGEQMMVLDLARSLCSAADIKSREA